MKTERIGLKWDFSQPSNGHLAASQEYIKEENPNSHGVAPHYVEGYYRADGTYVEGYWRDGDGDTSVNHTAEQGGGWNQSNPDYRIPADKA